MIVRVVFMFLILNCIKVLFDRIYGIIVKLLENIFCVLVIYLK